LLSPTKMTGAKAGPVMNTRLSIGDFSRMTYLSIKALRRYHEMGLLVPAAVDPYSGFRYYEPAQVPVGQVIRRFRDLDMPLDQVKEVLQAPDAAARNEVIVAHLRHMEKALEQTQQTVASLRSLLEQAHEAPIRVEYRSVPDTAVLAISAPAAMSDVGEWWGKAFAELHRALEVAGAPRIGPDGALYSSEFFEAELGESWPSSRSAIVARHQGGCARPGCRAPNSRSPCTRAPSASWTGPTARLARS
jgi:DNA-binding transcriptional MerR regulator